jgi:HK97 family phage prohead protease
LEQLRYGLSLPIREIKATDDGAWECRGYVSTYDNVDHQGDAVMAGAFARTLANNPRPKFLFGHDTKSVLGVTLDLKEDAHGLFGRFKISKTTLGQDVHTLLKDGAIDAFSIGYIPTDVEYKDDVRLLKDVDLVECSLVPIPANERALVTAVKARLDEAVPPDETDDGEKAEAEAKPYSIVKRGNEYCVRNDDSGETEKCHPTRAEAMRHQRALMANVSDAGKDSSDGPKGLTFIEHLDRVLDEIARFVARSEQYAEVRAADGRKQSDGYFGRLKTLRARVDELLTLEGMPKGTRPLETSNSIALRLELERRRLRSRRVLEPDNGDPSEPGGDALGARRPD